MKRSLPRSIVKAIYAAVDSVFNKAITRLTARPPVDKRIYIGGGKPRRTLASLFEAASAEEHAKADQDVLRTLLDVAEGFIDAQRHSTKAHVVKSVEAWLNKAAATGVETDVETVLQGELAGVFRKATEGIQKIVATESNVAKNTGTLDGVVRVNAASGIEDPVVYFVVVRDNSLCPECKRIHLMADEKTPRLWYLSEVGHGYHKKGEENPKLAGLHPNCRCSMATLLPGYGFDGAGMVSYIKPDHIEIDAQRGVEKHERIYHERLFKSTPAGKKHYHANQDEWEANGRNMREGEHSGDWRNHLEEHAGFDSLADNFYERFKDHLRQAPITINFPWKRLGAIAETGRFKNVFEVGHSEGSGLEEEAPGYNAERLAAEWKVLGIPIHVPMEERPVYGAVNSQWNRKNYHSGGADGYGDMFVTLKPHVKNRSSFTPDDSFCTHPEETVTHKHLPKMFSHLKLRQDPNGGVSDFQSFIEAQIHGGVDLNHDVESLHLSYRTPPAMVSQAIEVGKKYKLPVYHQAVTDYKDQPQPPKLVYHPDHELPAPAQPETKTVDFEPEPKPQQIYKAELSPLLDASGLVAVGDVPAFNLFKAEKHKGVLVAFKGAETGVELQALTKMVQEAATATCPTARIFLSRKNFKIFVQDKAQADSVIASIQNAVLGD